MKLKHHFVSHINVFVVKTVKQVGSFTGDNSISVMTHIIQLL